LVAKYRIKPYSVYDLKPGMELGRMVLTQDNKVILSERTILSTSMIEGLKFWDIETVFIKDQLSGKDEFDLYLPESDAQKKFYANYNDTVCLLKNHFLKLRFLKKVPVQIMQDLVHNLIELSINSPGVINHLNMVRRQDDYTFHHSVSVAVFCGVLGKWLSYTGQELQDLVLTGLMHDVGKTQIPLEILNKPGKLTAEEMKIMRLHTIRGYQMIRDMPDVPQGVIYGVLQHHERFDGSGYPFAVPGDEIHKYARVIAIVDIYDAMTSNRVYHCKKSPFDVVETIVEEMFDKLDPSIGTVFLNNVRDYLIGNIVELSDGRHAEVIYLGHFLASRPIVVTQDKEYIDLECNKSLSIVRVVRA